MKRTLAVFAVFMLIYFQTFSATNSQGGGGIEKHEFDYNGGKREYCLHIPAGIKPNAPLVFFLHGYGGIADKYEGFMGLDAVADKNGFVAVYPQGLLDDVGGYPHWNAGFTISSVDDVGFLSGLAKFLQSKYDLDTERTFTSGVSDGAFMSYYLISERPDVFKAAASIYGTMSGKNWDNRKKNSPVPVLQLSAALDTLVPVAGIVDTTGGVGGAPEIETVVSFWNELNSCTVTDTVAINKHTTAYYHRSEVGNNEVWYYLIDNFGHHDLPLGQNGSVHASRLIWEFFSRY